ncbi:probable cytochrome b-c1 complex subunit 8 [Coccomyxa sp. Obi]|nr:probable cytochrome b-c1 complex subunit 8 [Coccomyxa sp. Obi]
MELPLGHDGKMGRVQSLRDDRLTKTGVFDLVGMGKVPVRLKEVTYTISPFEVSVLSGLFKDLPSKIHHKFQQHWVDVGLFFVLPTYATFWYAKDFKEKEKNEHRY